MDHFHFKTGRKEGKPLCGFALPHLLGNYFPLKFSGSFHSEPVSTLPRQDHWLQFMWPVFPKCITCTKNKVFLTPTVSWWILSLHLCSSYFASYFSVPGYSTDTSSIKCLTLDLFLLNNFCNLKVREKPWPPIYLNRLMVLWWICLTLVSSAFQDQCLFGSRTQIQTYKICGR